MKERSAKTLTGRKDSKGKGGKRVNEVDHIAVTSICEIKVLGFSCPHPTYNRIYTKIDTEAFRPI